MDGEYKALTFCDAAARQDCYMAGTFDGEAERRPFTVLIRSDLRLSKSFDSSKRQKLKLCRPSILLMNFNPADSLRLEFALHLCATQIGDMCIDVINLGSSKPGLRELTGSVAVVVLLKIPHPKHDPRGFTWARKTLNELGEKKMLTVVPVIRDQEQAPVFMRAIASACPYYMSSQTDFLDQCRMLTVLIEGLC